MSFRAKLDAICTALPGAVWADPASNELASWKVGGKMFACVGSKMPGVSVKTAGAETAQVLIEAGIAQKAPYFPASWVRLGETVDTDELRHRVHASYDIVRGTLTKKVQAALPERGGD